jgi:hypothetical protein
VPDALDIIIGDTGDTSFMCHKHGEWYPIVRKIKGQKVINRILDLPLDYAPEYPDEPPF